MEELDLKELFNTCWRQKYVMLVIILLISVIGVVYTFFYVKPMYESYTTLVLKQVTDVTENEIEEGKSAIKQSDVSLNSVLVSTYSELIKSKTVLREVLKNLSITDITEGNLRKNITVTSVQDTEMIQITVKCKNGEYASKIANEIAKVFSEKIVEIYSISNIYVVDEAETSGVPTNINHVRDIALFAIIGVVVSAMYILVYNMFDNTIKTEQDIEDISGLVVLASILDFDIDSAKGGR